MPIKICNKQNATSWINHIKITNFNEHNAACVKVKNNNTNTTPHIIDLRNLIV
jgi:hypothetical protein